MLVEPAQSIPTTQVEGAEHAQEVVDEEVYDGLHRIVGRRKISGFRTELARPHVVSGDLEAGYLAMAADEEHEREALEWIEGMVADVRDERG